MGNDENRERHDAELVTDILALEESGHSFASTDGDVRVYVKAMASRIEKLERKVDDLTRELADHKSVIGRRLSELRIEKRAIEKPRTPAGWYAREFGWHIRPDQWGMLATLLPPSTLEQMLALFDSATDKHVVERFHAIANAWQTIESVLDAKQTSALERLQRWVADLPREM